MASPTIETFCCVASNIEPSILKNLQFNSLLYNIVCTVSSIFGTAGALYQIIPIPRDTSRSFRNVANRQRSLICWLAVSDFFASLAILFRSIFWLVNGDIIKNQSANKNTDIIICTILSVCIRYFFTATALWTLCYAIDVYLVSRQKVCNYVHYHTFTWITSGVLTVAGLGTLYLPRFQCHSGALRVLPNYLLSFFLLVFIMILNPVLYKLASKHLRILVSSCGQLTCLEQNLLSALKEKFFCIVLVFYVCWIPNVLNGLILWIFWDNMNQTALLIVWYLMAFLNPMQAFLNSLVYKGWVNCPEFCSTIFCFGCRVRQRRRSLTDELCSDYSITSADQSVNFSTNRDVY